MATVTTLYKLHASSKKTLGALDTPDATPNEEKCSHGNQNGPLMCDMGMDLGKFAYLDTQMAKDSVCKKNVRRANKIRSSTGNTDPQYGSVRP